MIDPDGVYDPRVINDRLLLGLKGTMSEFELNLLRQRSLESIRQKARRGELQFVLPAGFCWTHHGKVEKDPDQRVQQAIELVFRKFAELGSARQVLLWFRSEGVVLPESAMTLSAETLCWRRPCIEPSTECCSTPCTQGPTLLAKRKHGREWWRACTEDRWPQKATRKLVSLAS